MVTSGQKRHRHQPISSYVASIKLYKYLNWFIFPWKKRDPVGQEGAGRGRRAGRRRRAQAKARPWSDAPFRTEITVTLE
jgi:hypothetical protein